MAKYAMMLPSYLVKGRHELLERFLKSFQKWGHGKDYDLYMFLQGEQEETQPIAKYKDMFTKVKWSREPLGTALPRTTLLRDALESSQNYQAFIFVDDDMILMPETDYTEPIKKVGESGVGVVSLVMQRNEKSFAKINLRDEYEEIPAMNVMGGMAMSRECAELVVKCEEYRKWNVLDIFSIYLYTLGYKNYKYFGSASVHTSVAKGGLREYRKTVKDVMPFDGIYGEDLLSHPEKVSDLAKKLHQEQRELKKWN